MNLEKNIKSFSTDFLQDSIKNYFKIYKYIFYIFLESGINHTRDRIGKFCSARPSKAACRAHMGHRF